MKEKVKLVETVGSSLKDTRESYTYPIIDLTIPEGEDIRPLFDPKDPKAAAFLDEILRAKAAEDKEQALQETFLKSISDWNMIDVPPDGNCLFY